jgi:hypothetical protein
MKASAPPMTVAPYYSDTLLESIWHGEPPTRQSVASRPVMTV